MAVSSKPGSEQTSHGWESCSKGRWDPGPLPRVTESLRWLSSLAAKRASALPAGYMQSSRNATFLSPANWGSFSMMQIPLTWVCLVCRFNKSLCTEGGCSQEDTEGKTGPGLGPIQKGGGKI